MIGESVRVETPPIIDPQLFHSAQLKREKINSRKHQTNPTKNFYLLRDFLICGHCSTSMGGRINREGHQNYYYCVTKERSWVSRLIDDGKWKNGSRCSMVRSLNIVKTDHLVWEMVVSTLIELQQYADSLSESFSNSTEEFNGYDGFSVDELNDKKADLNFYQHLKDFNVLLTEDNSTLLTDQHKKMILSKYVNKINVYYDKNDSKHLLEVEFKLEVSSLLQRPLSRLELSKDTLVVSRSDLNINHNITEDLTVKKSVGIMSAHTTFQNYSVTVE
jgi:hypothetical protein